MLPRGGHGVRSAVLQVEHRSSPRTPAQFPLSAPRPCNPEAFPLAVVSLFVSLNLDSDLTVAPVQRPIATVHWHRAVVESTIARPECSPPPGRGSSRPAWGLHAQASCQGPAPNGLGYSSAAVAALARVRGARGLGTEVQAPTKARPRQALNNKKGGSLAREGGAPWTSLPRTAP